MSNTFNFKKLADIKSSSMKVDKIQVEAMMVEAMAVPFWGREAYEWHTIPEINSGNVVAWNSYIEAVPSAIAAFNEINARDITKVRTVMENYSYNEEQAREVITSLVGISPEWGIYYLSIGPYQASKLAWKALAKMTGDISGNSDRSDMDRRLAILRSPELSGVEAWKVPNQGSVTYGQVAQDIEDDLQNRFSMFMKRYQAPNHEMMMKAVKNAIAYKFPQYLGILDERDLSFELHSSGSANGTSFMPGVNDYNQTQKGKKHPVFNDLSENSPLMAHLREEDEKAKEAKSKGEKYIRHNDFMLPGSAIRLGPDGLKKIITSLITGEKPIIRKEILQVLASINTQAETTSTEALSLIHFTDIDKLPPTLAKLRREEYFPTLFNKYTDALKKFFDDIVSEVKMHGSAQNVLDHDMTEEQSPEYQEKKKTAQSAMEEFWNNGKKKAQSLTGVTPEVIEDTKLARELGKSEMFIVKKIYAAMRSYQVKAIKNKDPRVTDMMPIMLDSEKIMKQNYRVGQQIPDASAAKSSFANFSSQKEQMLVTIMEIKSANPNDSVQYLAIKVATKLNNDEIPEIDKKTGEKVIDKKTGKVKMKPVRKDAIRRAKVAQAVLAHKSMVDTAMAKDIKENIALRIEEETKRNTELGINKKPINFETAVRNAEDKKYRSFGETIADFLRVTTESDREDVISDAIRYYRKLLRDINDPLYSEKDTRTGEYTSKIVEGWISFFEQEKQTKNMDDQQLLEFYGVETDKFIQQKKNKENFENMPDLHSATQLAEATLACGSNLGGVSEDIDVESEQVISESGVISRPGEFVDVLTGANIFAPGTKNILPMKASPNATATILTKNRNFKAALEDSQEELTPEERLIENLDAEDDEVEVETEKIQEEAKATEEEIEEETETATTSDTDNTELVTNYENPEDENLDDEESETDDITVDDITGDKETTMPEDFKIDEVAPQVSPQVSPETTPVSPVTPAKNIPFTAPAPAPTTPTNFQVDEYEDKPVLEYITHDDKGNELENPYYTTVIRKVKKQKPTPPNPITPITPLSYNSIKVVKTSNVVSAMSDTINNLIKIARELDIAGKLKESEEVHKVIRKYINNDSVDSEKGSL